MEEFTDKHMQTENIYNYIYYWQSYYHHAMIQRTTQHYKGPIM